MTKSPKPLRSILIANRGEIAVRVARSARQLGYKTIAVYSDADAGAGHTRAVDQAVAIGGNTPRESYLSIDKILQAAAKSGADAIHPGYGFLSENSEFARRCVDAGLVFIGPSPEAIDAMGNKSLSKKLMLAAGVPCIPGYQGEEQDLDFLYQKGVELGFPLMVKAAAGGGGRGLRLATHASELKALLKSARTEAERAFASGELLLERALTAARHVEIQVFGDSFGNVIHLGERDCSIQRRHQKVFEECPSPAVSPELRERMGATAVKAAQAINYSGAGTVEFLLDKDGQFYFLEMNTRLQVEHPVTEFVTGTDLVAWQLQIAAGEKLPLTQSEVNFQGCAIEARLYAEDPDSDFRPQVGQILRWQPASEIICRTDHGLNPEDQVSPFYDSMIAKVIAHGPDRQTCLRKLERGLRETVLLGLKTNREFLLHCLQEPDFVSGNADTGFVAAVWPPAENNKSASDDNDYLAMSCALFLWRDLPPTSALTGWSSNGHMHCQLKLSLDAKPPQTVQLEISRDREKSSDKARPTTARSSSPLTCQIKVGSQPARTVSIAYVSDGTATINLDGSTHKLQFIFSGTTLYVSGERGTANISDLTFAPPAPVEVGSDGNIVAPASGLLESVAVEPGQSVEKGAPLFTIEAMKLMQTVTAPIAGTITAVLGKAGEQVKAKQLVVQIQTPESPAAGKKKAKSEELELCPTK